MKYVVVKIPDNDGVISKSARFFEKIEEAVVYQQETPYNTVLAFVEEGDKPPLLERFLNWFYGNEKPTV